MTASTTVTRLSSTIEGDVILPDDAGYDEARTIFAGGFDGRPAVIVRPAHTEDVVRVVDAARESGLELAVRSGGHSSAGHSVCDGGIVLDLRSLDGIEIDAEGRTAWAQAGLTAGAYTEAAAEHGLATGFGDTGSVGLGGITLGGGVGFLSRKHGLTVDALLAAEVVTADGRVLTVDADNHPDLFWAIRGGGGNFGVVTRLRLALQEVGTVVGGMLMVPATAANVTAFVAAAEAAPEELSTIVNVMPAPPMPFVPAEQHGRMVVMGLLCFAGDPADAEAVLKPFRSIAEPVADLVRPIPYPEMFPPDPGDYHPTAAGHTMFLDRVDETVVATVLEHLERSAAPMRVCQLRPLGGAIARVPGDATAYAHRESRFMVNLAAFYSDEAELADRETWLAGFAAALQQEDTGAYVNFLGVVDADRVRDAYPGATWDRLVDVKTTYDPGNLFRRNQNIPPR